jgi:hypothetical protein
LRDLGVDAKIIIKYTLRINIFRVLTEFLFGRKQGSVVGFCEYGHEPTGSIKAGNFVDTCKPVSFSILTLFFGVNNSKQF